MRSRAWLAVILFCAVFCGCERPAEERESPNARADREPPRAAATGAVLPVDLGAIGDPVTWTAFTSPFIGQVRRLTSPESGIRRAGEGYFSPDGRTMVFQAERDTTNPFFQIYLMDLESGAFDRVSSGTGKTTCAFLRPGHDEVLYASSHEDPDAVRKQNAELEVRALGERRRRGAWDYDPLMDLFVARRDGSELRRITDAHGYDAEGAFSPDGSRIVFCSTRSGYTEGPDGAWRLVDTSHDPEHYGEIYLANAHVSDVVRLTETPGYDGGPFFTPDGTRIVWRRFDATGEIAEIYTMALDGSDVRQLTSLGHMSWAPYFHPSGAYAIFTTNVHGFANFELYLVDAGGEKQPVRVTDAPAFDGLPVFHPGGGHLVWTSSRTENRQGQLFIGAWDHAGAMAALEAAPRRQVASRD